MNKPTKDSVLTTGPSTVPVRLGVGSWTIIVVLVALLGVTGFVAYVGWMSADGTEVSTSGYVSMALGVILSLAIGFGLMGLIFYSSRSGYDEPPVLITTDGADGTKSPAAPHGPEE